MRIGILEVCSRRRGLVNKDVSGGMGIVSNYGTSFIPALLTYVKKKGIKYPILTMSYLASIFEKHGHYIELFVNEVPSDVDIVFIYSSIVDYKTEIKFAKKVRQTNKRIKIGFLGTFATVMPEMFLEYADFVIKGEPEEALLSIAKHEIEPQGIIESNPINQLDMLPFPYWKPFLRRNQFSYLPYFLFQRKKKFFPILSSRGCPLSCAYYCPYPIIAKKRWRKRSYQNVVDEIEYLVTDYDAGLLLFRDPIFSLDKTRSMEIAREIIRRKIKIRYVCETHLSYLDKELIDALYASGLRALKVGIESVDNTILQSFKRKTVEIKHQEKVLNYCEHKGIAITVFYIFGLPEDTRDTILNTIAYAKKLNTVGAQFRICTPYPGTKFYEDLKKEGRILSEEFEEYDINTPVFKHLNLSCRELLELKNHAYQTYYFRFPWLLKFLKVKMLKWS